MSFADRLFSPVDRLIAALTDPARRERTVLVSLAIYGALWTLFGVIAKANQGVHYDMAELVAWSREPALGYAKHPPLAAWLVRCWFSVFPLADWAFYLLAMTLVCVALWIGWRLFARFLDAEKRVVALALLTLVPFFNFHALKVDHNVVLIPLWAATTLWFIRSFETRNNRWAALAGAGAAAAVLAKYWSVYLLAGLGLAALFDPRRREYFRSPAPWITIAVGELLIAPNVAWLIANDFSPMFYAVSVHTLVSIRDTLTSVAGYLIGAAGYIALPVVLVLALSRPDAAVFSDVLRPKTPERQFAAIAFWTPLLAPAAVALAIGLELNSMWSMSGLVLLPVVLLSSPFIVIGRTAVRAIVMCAVVLPVLMVAAAPGLAILTHRSGAITSSAAHGQSLAERIEQEWRKATDKPLRLIGGDLDLAYVTAFYLPSGPSAFPVSEPQLAPWADAARIAREGIALVCHSDGRDCLHRLVAGPVDALIAQGPTGRREVVEIARDFLGLPGKPARYVIIIIPPRP